MNTNMIGLRWFSKMFASLCVGRKKLYRLLALEGLTGTFHSTSYIATFLFYLYIVLDDYAFSLFSRHLQIRRI